MAHFFPGYEPSCLGVGVLSAFSKNILCAARFHRNADACKTITSKLNNQGISWKGRFFGAALKKSVSIDIIQKSQISFFSLMLLHRPLIRGWLFFFVSDKANFANGVRLSWTLPLTTDDLNRNVFQRSIRLRPWNDVSGFRALFRLNLERGLYDEDRTQLYNMDRHVQAWQGAALCKLKLEGAVRSSPLHVCISYALFPTCRCVQSRAKPIPLGRSMRAYRIYQLIADWFIARKKSKKMRRTHEWNCFRWFRHTRLRARTNVSPWLFIRRYFMKAVC